MGRELLPDVRQGGASSRLSQGEGVRVETLGAGVLHSALSLVPAGAWSQASSFAHTGVHHGYRRVVLVSDGHQRNSYFADVLEQFDPVYEAWLSWIEPGGFIIRHRDGGPYRERWQVPIVAGALEGYEPEAGRPFMVWHWVAHAVPPSGTHRIHLVIDRDVIANPDPAPFWKDPDAHQAAQGIPSHRRLRTG